MMHAWWGNYGLSAVSVALEHCLAGNKAKSNYIEKPILSTIQQNSKHGLELTEEEKQREVDLFFSSENARRVNWKRNKRKDDSVS